MARKKQITVDEWVTKVSEKSGVNPNLTKAVLDTVSEIICEEVKEDKRECYIPNFGTFIRATHKGHPLNLDIEGLEKKETPEYDTFKFKPVPSYKEKVVGRK